jgi:hypothetical protein
MKKMGLMAILAILALTGVSNANSNLFYPYVNLPIGSKPDAVAIGDLNGDGRQDVVVATSQNGYPSEPDNDYHLHVFLQNESGGLVSPVRYPLNSPYNYYSAPSITIGDINHDGRDDVIVGNGNINMEVFLQNASGGLNPGMTYPTGHTSALQIADLNNDGLLDIAGLDLGTRTIAGFFQNSNGTLNPPVILYARPDDLIVHDFVLCDFNGDGLKDVIAYIVSFSVEVLFQNLEGGFADPAIFDLSHHNIRDAHEFAAGDVNGDGLPDIVLTYGGNKPYSRIGILFQDNLGSFQPMVSYDALDIPATVAVADMNIDGKKDIVVAHPGWDAVGTFLQDSEGVVLPEETYPVPFSTWPFNPPMAIGDINGDGLQDIVGIHDSDITVLYSAWGETEIVSTPATPEGPGNCTTEFPCTYTVGGSQSDFGHPVQYLIDWGDGTDSGWRAASISNVSKQWILPGTYSIRAKARCSTDTSIESEWSSSFSVTVSYSGTEIWAMSAGNYWDYTGTDLDGNHWVSRVQINGPDTSTIPGMLTYEARGYGGGVHRASTWYSVTDSEMREWEERVWDNTYSRWLILNFSGSLLLARNPIIVGDHWTSTVTAYVSGGPSVTPFSLSLEVNVLSFEVVTVPRGVYKAYKFQQILHVWANGVYDRSSRYLWYVPYLGFIKIEDEPGQVETITATNVTVPLMFLDVPPLHFARTFIESLATAGITGGCTTGPPSQFCPDDTITRGQMAVFLVSSLGGTPDACTGRFRDVPIDHPFCGFIESLAAGGITGGCTATDFCPDAPVTRGQMAVFIEVALGIGANTCTGRFVDVPNDHPFCGFIERLAADGITGGCTVTHYCPDAPVTRGQMAVFLVAAPPPLIP